VTAGDLPKIKELLAEREQVATWQQAELMADSRPAEPVLVQEAYRGYNLVRFGRRTFAVPQASGPSRSAATGLGGYVSGATVSEVHRLLSEQTADERARSADGSSQPFLILEGHRGHNLVRFGQRTYAVRQSTGPFLPEAAQRGDYIVGSTAAEVTATVDALIHAELERNADLLPDTAILIDTTYDGMNLIRYRRRTFAINRNDGAFDIERFRAGGFVGGVEAASAEEALPALASASAIGVEIAVRADGQKPIPATPTAHPG